MIYESSKVSLLILHRFLVILGSIQPKAKLLQEGIFFLVHLFDRDELVMKKFEIKKTKPTLIISVLKLKMLGGLSVFDFQLFY